jgi:hypothetical protein
LGQFDAADATGQKFDPHLVFKIPYLTAATYTGVA